MREKLRWHGRRYGRPLSLKRKHLIETLLPKFSINLPKFNLDEGEKKLPLFLDLDVWLEIGFGSGEHIAGQASRNPEVKFIGCEPYMNGVAALLAKIQEMELNNIYIFNDDARQLLRVLPESSIGKVFFLFGDPWPKKRHKNRRLINKDNLAMIARILKNSGELRFASDHSGYTNWALQHLLENPKFYEVKDHSETLFIPPEDWIETRYERKAKLADAQAMHLRFRRKKRVINRNNS